MQDTDGENNALGRRDQAKSVRAARIHAAAHTLLLRKSFDEITTREVAEEAGIGEATLFRYIGSKQRLLTMVYGDQLDEMLNRIEEADAARMSAEQRRRGQGNWYLDRVYAAYKARCDFYLLSPHNAALYLREGFVPGGEATPRHVAQGDRTIRLVAAILVEGQGSGALRADVDAHTVAQNCHGTYIHEIDRTPVRGFDPNTIWARLHRRLNVQLEPLVVLERRGSSPRR